VVYLLVPLVALAVSSIYSNLSLHISYPLKDACFCCRIRFGVVSYDKSALLYVAKKVKEVLEIFIARGSYYGRRKWFEMFRRKALKARLWPKVVFSWIGWRLLVQHYCKPRFTNCGEETQIAEHNQKLSKL